MKLRFTYILILISSFSIHAQSTDYYDEFFGNIFGAKNLVNPYYIGDNPAFLNFDYKDQLLEAKTRFSNASGQFKRFIDPGNSRIYQVGFAGKKLIDSTQIFKGTFAFQRLERGDWSWIVSRDYNNGSPFLLGDSTTGRSRYNGIIVGAEYSQIFFEHLLTGLKINYLVDEGLKEVSPRPTSDHRDIGVSLGMGYEVFDKTFFGFVLKAFDFSEQINYREDVGAVSKETILFKFRGYDYPFVIRKKVETRYSYHNGYSGNLNFFYNGNSGFSASAMFGGGIEQIVVKDDANNPRRDGYWKNTNYTGQINTLLILSENFNAGISYKFQSYSMWAKHPEFNVIFMDNDFTRHGISGGAEYKLNNNLILGAEVSVDLIYNKYNDYYSDISWKADGIKYNPKLGISIKPSEMLELFTAYCFSIYNLTSNKTTVNSTTQYYDIYRISDVVFYQSDFTAHSLYFRGSLEPGFLGKFLLHIFYNSSHPKNSTHFENTSRNTIDAVLELRIKVY